jgi:hypothetical protein
LDGDDHTFDTPEEAAVAGFPSRYAGVESVEYHEHGNSAKVTLMTNEEPYLYPYYVYCERNEHGALVRDPQFKLTTRLRGHSRTLAQPRL